MKDRNICTFTGRITGDPELKNFAGGEVTNFSIAVNSSWKDKKGEKKEEVVFVNFDAWSNQAKFIAEYCKKGDFVLVDSEYKTSSTDVDGERKHYHKFRVVSLQKLSWAPVEGSATKKKTKIKEEDSEDIEQLPF